MTGEAHEVDDRHLTAGRRADEVATLTAKIRNCDVCGTPTHYVINVTEMSAEHPKLMPSTGHVICEQFRALSRHVTVLEDGLTSMAADVHMVRNEVFRDRPSLRARIRSLAKLTLSRLASRL